MHNSLFRVSGLMALAIVKLLANGYVVGHRAPPIGDSRLTIVEAEKMRLVIDLRYVINYFSCETFLFNKYKSHRQPMHLGECPGFVVNTVAMTFQIAVKRIGG